MKPDRFEATFVVSISRGEAWKRLTEHPVDSKGDVARYWLPGFDTAATVIEEEPEAQLLVTKDEEPCAGTEIVVTLTDSEAGTQITVVQSRFGEWLPTHYDMMAVGWRHIVADLHAYLATGAHAARHLRAWGDLGADAKPVSGGMRVSRVRAGTLAERLGLQDDDLIVALAGAPVSSYDDLVTVLRVIGSLAGDVRAEWIRNGVVQTATATAT